MRYEATTGRLRVAMQVDAKELAARKRAWIAPPLKTTRGTLYK